MSEELKAVVAKLQAFKDYVHQRLDAMGVPVDPESPHKAAGCRIGGRLDYVEARIEAATAPMSGLSEVAELVEAAKDYMSQFGQGYEACGIPFGPAQKEADERIRAALRRLASASVAGGGEVVAWRGINELGEVVTDWQDGTPPPKLYDLCGNEASYASIQLAYATPAAAPGVTDEAIQRALVAYYKDAVYDADGHVLNNESSMRRALRAALQERQP